MALTANGTQAELSNSRQVVHDARGYQLKLRFCPVKQKRALLRSNLPRDNWRRATKRRRPTPGRSKAALANRPDHVSEPSQALKKPSGRCARKHPATPQSIRRRFVLPISDNSPRLRASKKNLPLVVLTECPNVTAIPLKPLR